jgi:ubiquinone/menaquinone biosynthesis C-methylase UbiE
MNLSAPNADQRFVDFYAQQSISESTKARFEGTRRVTLALRSELQLPTQGLDVLDVGCGTGSQALLWQQSGHRTQGIDISVPLIDLARERAAQSGLLAQFSVGSADRLPIQSGSVDIVLISELLEHLPDWKSCLNEALRVLRPGGVVYLSTTNRLCPKQMEFDLPAYSWYPNALKKRLEKLAMTSHGHWVQFASFPAVHWFTFYQLRDYLDERGFSARDRFDVMDTKGSVLRTLLKRAVQSLRPLRFVAHVLTPFTLVVAYRRV